MEFTSAKSVNGERKARIARGLCEKGLWPDVLAFAQKWREKEPADYRALYYIGLGLSGIASLIQTGAVAAEFDRWIDKGYARGSYGKLPLLLKVNAQGVEMRDICLCSEAAQRIHSADRNLGQVRRFHVVHGVKVVHACQRNAVAE